MDTTNTTNSITEFDYTTTENVYTIDEICNVFNNLRMETINTPEVYTINDICDIIDMKGNIAKEHSNSINVEPSNINNEDN